MAGRGRGVGRCAHASMCRCGAAHAKCRRRAWHGGPSILRGNLIPPHSHCARLRLQLDAHLPVCDILYPPLVAPAQYIQMSSSISKPLLMMATAPAQEKLPCFATNDKILFVGTPLEPRL